MSRHFSQLKRFRYYLFNTLSLLTPSFFYQLSLSKKLSAALPIDHQYVQERVNYYNKLSTVKKVNLPLQVGSLRKTHGTTYFFDLRKVVKYFPKYYEFSAELGDIRHIPELPSFLKSRPIDGDNQNSVLLKLNMIRHFNFVDDVVSYKDKKDLAAWRGVGHQQHRKVVIKKFYNHARCNIGQTKPRNGEPWEMGIMTIEEQLQYKFLLCIEGNDVATNLKWVMSSNSLCLMSKPKYETWFMEGRLEAGTHYVELKDDYSDLIEKMDYYLAHEDEALAIISNANAYVEQFKNESREELISLLVAQKYFKQTGQL